MFDFFSFPDYGEKDNDDLAQRFGLKKSQFPVYKLFLDGNVNDPKSYSGSLTSAEEIHKFIMRETGKIL